MIHFKVVLNILGILLMLMALFMPLGIPFSLYYGDDDVISLLQGTGITLLAGLLLFALSGFRRQSYEIELNKREGYLIVFLGWILVSGFGALPFVLHGSIPSYTDAFFETISGFTTTGASILNNIESLPHGMLFWRSMTHWLGGMGIILLSLAILPLLGIGGAQLFVAEVAGPTKDKIHPQIRGTAKRLWIIYLALTLAETFLLLLGGMNLFEALCHSFGTVATGGFSTRQGSVAAYDSPFIHYVIIVFMLLVGTNFSLHYHALHGRLGAYFRDEEFRLYLIICLVFTALVTGGIYLNTSAGLERSFRDGAFQVVSIISSTGFVTADYEKWTPYSGTLFFIMLFFGACAGSTTGGIKIIRVLLLSKNAFLELKRLIHPHAVVPVKFNGKSVPPAVMNNVLAFFVLYIMAFLVGTLIMALTGLDFPSSMGATAATLGCIGPGVGSVGPLFNYSHVSVFGKWVLSFLMLLGRLEIFTIIIIFSPGFRRA